MSTYLVRRRGLASRMPYRRVAGGVAAVAAVALSSGVAAPAQAQDCLCATFVTAYDSDGSGPAALVTRKHSDLKANLDHYLDVDGQSAPAAAPLPGYELRVRVEGLDAAKPKIITQKLTSAALPLKVEVVKQNGSGVWTSLGYDALRTATGAASSAPVTFSAQVDTSNSDSDPYTENAYVDATITGAPAVLAIVNEQFGGDPAGTRTNRSIRRLAFSGSSAIAGSRVPGRVSVAVTKGAKLANFYITRDVDTILDYDVSAPGQPRITGKVTPLRNSTSLTIASDVPVDTDNDGTKEAIADMTLDYAAAAAADVTFKSVLGSTSTSAEITQLPSDAHLTYLDDSSPSAGTGRTNITYRANARTPKVKIDHSAVENVNGTNMTRTLSGEVLDLPANIKYLDRRASPSGDWVAYKADSRAAKLTLTAARGGGLTQLISTRLPSEMRLNRTVSSGITAYHYDALEKAGSTSFLSRGWSGSALNPSRFGLVLKSNSAVDVVPTRVDIRNEPLPNGRRMTYSATSPIDSVHVTVDPGSAFNSVYPVVTTLAASGVPTTLNFEQTSDKTVSGNSYFTYVKKSADTWLHSTTGRIGRAEIVVATKQGTTRLPATENGALVDGFLLRDVPGTYSDVIHARATQLANLRVKTFSSRRIRSSDQTSETLDSTLNVEYDSLATANSGIVDMFERPEADDTAFIRKAWMESIPRGITLATKATPKLKTATYNALDRVVKRAGSTHASAVEYVERTHEPDAGIERLEQEITLNPMPRTASLCRSLDTSVCAEDTFHDEIYRINSGGGSWDCFANCPSFGWDPAKPNKGTLGIKTSEPVALRFVTPESALRFTQLQRFLMQAHADTNDDRGYLGIDTNGLALLGELTDGPNIETKLVFDPGFQTDDYVWSAARTTWASGGVASTGQRTCGPNTRIKLAGTDRTSTFCTGKR